MARPIDADILLQEFDDMEPYEEYENEHDLWLDIRMEILNASTLTPPNEWVSVEERLPEDKQIVLFHQKNGFIYCAEYFAGNKLLSPAWFIDNDCWEANEVTHWMPLPAPPDRRPPEGNCEIKDYAETCDECGFCGNTPTTPPEGEADGK